MVTNKKRGGEMVALSRETKNKDGLSVSLAIIDFNQSRDIAIYQ